MKKILVIGGGFAGVEAAIKLKKYNFDVTLISDRDYMYIYPLSIWIPTGAIDFKDAILPLNKLSAVHKFNLIIDSAVKISAKEKKVECKNGSYDFDYLVIAVGAGKAKPEGIENTYSICGAPEESLKIKEKLAELIKAGKGRIAVGIGGNPKDPSAMRGGPAFEELFNIDNLLRDKGLRDNFELNIFAPMETPGKRLGDKAYALLDRFYADLKINKYFGKKIKRFEAGAVVFEDDSKLESDLIIFVPAGGKHEIFDNSELPLTEAGFIKTDDYLMVEGLENIYAIGDSASLDGPPFRGKQGHVAEMMAGIAAYNINAKETGTNNYKGYKEHVHILCVMDNGKGAVYVKRDTNKETVIALPVVGHMLKKFWGWYYKNSKLKRFPRIPGF
ncbi:MAG: NAD(P)/FAD-dependent oxidoreductase [Candidatus Acidulodesulfobacterium sp.]